MEQNWKLLIFDWDGTLFDSLDLGFGSACHIFDAAGCERPTREEYFREIASDFVEFYRTGGVQLSVEEMNALRTEYFEEHWDTAELYENARELLGTCRRLGIKMAIVSGELEHILKRRLDEFGLCDLFDEVVGSQPGRPTQKDAKLLRVCSELSVNPEHACYVDDTVDGIEAAQRAGLHTVGMTHGFGSEEAIRTAEPDFVCHALHQVYELLTTLVIGIVGENGGGKDTLANNLHEIAMKDVISSVAHHRFSDPLKAALKAMEVPVNRESMQLLPVLLRQGFGDRVLANAVRDQALRASERIVLLNGVRWEVDLDMIRKWPQNFLVYVTAPARVRFERMRERARDSAEAKLTWEEFLEQEGAKTEQKIPAIGAQADWTYENTGTLADLQENTRTFCEKIAPIVLKHD